MFPNILMFHPEAARAILEYRIRTLGGALGNAQNLGYQVRGPGHWPQSLAGPAAPTPSQACIPLPRPPLWTELGCPRFPTLRLVGPQQRPHPHLRERGGGNRSRAGTLLWPRTPWGAPAALRQGQHWVRTGQKPRGPQ